MHSDGLACFSGVEADGCRHEATVTGGGRGSCETAGLVWVNTTLGNVQRSMDGSCHAVGPKYLARYPAELRFRFNRRYDLAAVAERLLRAAAATLPRPVRPSPAYLSGQEPACPTHPRTANGPALVLRPEAARVSDPDAGPRESGK